MSPESPGKGQGEVASWTAYVTVSLKMSERTLGTTFHRTAQGACGLLAASPRRWKASEQLGWLCPMPAVWRYYSNFIFGNSPRSERGYVCGTPISTLSTNRSQTESWSLAISVDTAKIGRSQIWNLEGLVCKDGHRQHLMSGCGVGIGQRLSLLKEKSNFLGQEMCWWV